MLMTLKETTYLSADHKTLKNIVCQQTVCKFAEIASKILTAGWGHGGVEKEKKISRPLRAHSRALACVAGVQFQNKTKRLGTDYEQETTVIIIINEQ